MTEKISTRWLYRRSQIDPSLSDVELEVELTQPELDLVEKIKSLETQEAISHGVDKGSTGVREYVTHHAVPYGGGLLKPRENLLTRMSVSRDFISSHMENITSETPACTPILGEILDSLNQILGPVQD